MEARSQSAMEYLMTYGWAILIIAVILGVLFSLGVFNPVNYAPRVPAGSCHVFRPNGPGTNFNVNLVGTCSGFLPQYVAHADGGNPPSISTTKALPALSEATVTGWINRAVEQINGGLGIASTTSGCFLYAVGNGATITAHFATWGCNPDPGPYYTLVAIPANQWVMIAYSVDSAGNVKSYDFEGSTTLTTSASGNVFTLPSSPWDIGGLPSTAGEINGSIANVQVYNTSLDANELQYLYNEGIGGAPIYLSHLVAWWPLNGDCKDYSGNNYDCHITSNVVYTGSWTSGYTSP